MAAYAAGDGDDAIIHRRFLSCRFSVIVLAYTDRSVTIEAAAPEVNKSESKDKAAGFITADHGELEKE
jgi:hypothetical protein